jgi:hypothetical protein
MSKQKSCGTPLPAPQDCHGSDAKTTRDYSLFSRFMPSINGCQP